MKLYEALVERIRAALGECPNDNLSGLATVLVEQAVNFRRKDGTIGTPGEVKHFLYVLTSGMVDIATELQEGGKRETMKSDTTLADDGYFGLCPHCHKTNGYINVGRSHWFLCDEHKVKWCAGANLFSGWREETEEEQRRAYYAHGIDKYIEVKPFYTREPAAPLSDTYRDMLLETGDIPF
jgi:hypothetical protein